VNGVEINPFLVNVGNDTKDYLEIGNVDFYATRFEDFIPEKKYDIIFSLANDDTIDGNTEFTFDEYVGKIQRLLNKGGHLMWETISPDTYDPELFKPKRTVLEKRFTLLDERMVKSEYPVNVPERRFLVFQNN
jgi:spermidine synthase